MQQHSVDEQVFVKGLRFLPIGLALLVALAVAPTSDAASPQAVDWRAVRLDVQQSRAAGTTFAWAELGSGPPLLLLNGTASPMSEWDPAFLAGLARSNRVIVFDYPGLGGSGPAPATWTFARASDWIAQFAAQVSPGEPVNVLGWSMGGFIAQQLAIRHPEVVRNLVLAATNPGGSSAVLGPTWVQEIDSSASSDADYLLTNYPPSGRQAGRRFLQRLTIAYDTGVYPESDVPERTLDAMVAAEDPWLRSDSNLIRLSTITKPTLVIDGARDVITPPVNSTVITSRIPHAQLRLIAGAGHSFLFQAPEYVSTVISAFLARSS